MTMHDSSQLMLQSNFWPHFFGTSSFHPSAHSPNRASLDFHVVYCWIKVFNQQWDPECCETVVMGDFFDRSIKNLIPWLTKLNWEGRCLCRKVYDVYIWICKFKKIYIAIFILKMEVVTFWTLLVIFMSILSICVILNYQLLFNYIVWHYLSQQIFRPVHPPPTY